MMRSAYAIRIRSACAIRMRSRYHVRTDVRTYVDGGYGCLSGSLAERARAARKDST
jgi:hypothetical protein